MYYRRVATELGGNPGGEKGGKRCERSERKDSVLARSNGGKVGIRQREQTASSSPSNDARSSCNF
jgi:hypothetical protein